MRTTLPILAVLLLAACGREPRAPDVPGAEPSPNRFRVAVTSTRGPVTIDVHRAWGPYGAGRFYGLVKSGYYDGACFFRVVPGFVAQFGLAADPRLTAAWSNKQFPDDSVRHSNARGTISFASSGPNTSTTQLFINLADHPRLDTMGFSPIGEVVRGLDVVDRLNAEYGETPSQDSIRHEGSAYLRREYARLDCITTARIEREWP